MREHIHYVQGASNEGRLMDPENLIEDLMLSEASDYEQRQALLRQVAVAQEQVSGQWISDVSGFCFRGGFAWCSEGWIERHIGVIPRWARTHTGRPPRRGTATSGGAYGDSSDRGASTSRTSRGGACGDSSDVGASTSRTSGEGARGHASDEVVSTSHTSEEGWTVVRPPKRARRVSPIPWDEVKIVYDAGCFKCGEKGHWMRDCRNEWLCHRCQEYGHIARYCHGARQAPKLAATGTSRSSPSEVPRMTKDQAREAVTSAKTAASSSRSGSSVMPKAPVVIPGVKAATSSSRSSSSEMLKANVANFKTAASTTRSGQPKRPLVIVDKPRMEVYASKSATASISRIISSEMPDDPRRGLKRNEAGFPKATEEVQKKVPKFKKCPVPWCTLNFYYKKGHVFGCHYPTALAMEGDASSTSAAAITRVRVIALQYLTRVLVGVSASIQDLVDFLNRSGCLEGREESQVDEWTRRVATEVAEDLEVPVPEKFTCLPINSPGVIFQYRVMLAVISLLGETGHNEFLQTFSVEQWPEPVPVVVKVDQEGRREVQIIETADVSSTSVDSESSVGEVDSTSVDAECGLEGVGSTSVDTESGVEEGVSSTSVDSHIDVITVPSESSTSSPRRSWLPEHSPELELDLCDMEVIDEVVGEEEPERDHVERRFLAVAPFKFESVDSHFHLDRLCKRIGVQPFSYQKAVSKVKPKLEEEVEVDGVVAVWCDPKSYPTKRQVAQLRKARVVSVVRIHPGKVIEGDVAKLADMLDNYEVVGLGEVGLDGTKEDPELQRRTLDEALVLLKSRPHLVLVLHCRPGARNSITGAYFELFYRCKGLLSPEQRIHLHCFNGTMEDVSLWLGYFPNTYFGYSLMVTRGYFDADSKLALKRLDAKRILLETDSPYFPAAGEELSSPAFIGVTAREVARIRECNREELLRQTAENAQQLYWS